MFSSEFLLDFFLEKKEELLGLQFFPSVCHSMCDLFSYLVILIMIFELEIFVFSTDIIYVKKAVNSGSEKDVCAPIGVGRH